MGRVSRSGCYCVSPRTIVPRVSTFADFHVFCPILARFVFCCVIVCAADVRAREVGGGGVRRVCRMMRDRSVESGEMTGDMRRYYFAGGSPCDLAGWFVG